MKVISTRLFAAVVSASLAIFASSASAAPINNWVIDPSGADQANANNTYSNLNTNSPTIGNGTPGIGASNGGGAVPANIGNGSANSGIITSAFPTLSLLDGQSISLSGSMTISGAKVTGEDVAFQFGLMYEPGTVENPVDAAGWLGYKTDNANAGQTGGGAQGRLRARTTTGTDFVTTTWISSAGGRDTGIASVFNSVLENGIFSSGTYSFGLTVERAGADVIVSASILGTGATTFTNVFGPVTVSDATQKTFDFNRVGLWSVSPLDADQISFSGIDVSVASGPVPGDFNGDGDVDGTDFVAWQTNFPTASGATLTQGDADSDGDVDGADFVVWQTNFPFTSAAGAAPVPEPASGILLIAAVGCGSLQGRRSRA